jgi:hypothetical protein
MLAVKKAVAFFIELSRFELAILLPEAKMAEMSSQLSLDIRFQGKCIARGNYGGACVGIFYRHTRECSDG